MPCHDPDAWRDQASTLSKKVDKLTEMLCRVLKICSTQAELGLPDDIAEWWEKHLKVDRERAEQERERALEQQLKEDALRKLTSEERRALGL